MRLALSRARPEDLLAIHLNDHFALIEAEAALARRALRANRGSVLGDSSRACERTSRTTAGA